MMVLTLVLSGCRLNIRTIGSALVESTPTPTPTPDPWTHQTMAWFDAYNFNVSNISPMINKAVRASDGGFLLSGHFNAIGRERVATGTLNLNPSTAAIDATYNTTAGTGFAGSFTPGGGVHYAGVYDIEDDPTDPGVQYYAGVFTSYNGVTVNKVARMNADGTLDTSFNPGVFEYLGSSQSYVTAVVPLSNVIPAYAGKVLVFGIFDEIDNTPVPSGVALLDHDGTLNTVDFSPATGGFDDASMTGLAITEAQQYTDGTIYAAGRFTTFNGYASPSLVQFLVQSNGLVMAGWMAQFQKFDQLQAVPALIQDFDISSAGIIYLTGSMTDYDSVAIGRVAALNLDGSPDAVFMANVSTGFDAGAYSIRLNQAETKLAVGGAFSFFDGNLSASLAVLNVDGSMDMGFSAGMGAFFSTAAAAIVDVEFDAAGNIFAGGSFDTWNGTNAINLVKLDATGAIDSTFDPGGSVNAIGKVAGPLTIYFSRGTIYSAGNSIFKLHFGNGELHVGGHFSYYGGVLANGYAKLDSEGVPVPKAVFNATSIPEVFGASIVELEDGSGDFYHLTTDLTFYLIYRMNSDGTLHAGYPGPLVLNDNTGGVLAVDSASNLYVGGNFTTVSGTGVPQGISKISPAGVVDAAFNAGLGTGFDAAVSAIEVTSDTVYLGGAFSTLNGGPMPGALRYFYAVNTADGTISPRIANVGAGPDAQVYAIKNTNNGVYVGGNFTDFSGPANYLAKLSNADGARVVAFDTQANSANSYITGIDIGTNGEILVSGAFTSYTGSTSIYGVVLDPVTAVADPGFSIDMTGSAVRMGKGFIPVNDGYIFYGLYNGLNAQTRRGFGRINSDGSTY
jgi:hypothetical protein